MMQIPLAALITLIPFVRADFYLGTFSGEGIDGAGTTPTLTKYAGCHLQKSNPDIDCQAPTVGCDWSGNGGEQGLPNFCNTPLPGCSEDISISMFPKLAISDSLKMFHQLARNLKTG